MIRLSYKSITQFRWTYLVMPTRSLNFILSCMTYDGSLLNTLYTGTIVTMPSYDSITFRKSASFEIFTWKAPSFRKTWRISIKNEFFFSYFKKKNTFPCYEKNFHFTFGFGKSKISYRYNNCKLVITSLYPSLYYTILTQFFMSEFVL